jgi:hypothetical protein
MIRTRTVWGLRLRTGNLVRSLGPGGGPLIFAAENAARAYRENWQLGGTTIVRVKLTWPDGRRKGRR